MTILRVACRIRKSDDNMANQVGASIFMAGELARGNPPIVIPVGSVW
jgi:hypothetical protein